MTTVNPNIQIGDEVRPMTDDEHNEWKQLKKEITAQQKQIAAKEAARQSALAKLADLGLTAEEIAAL